MQPQRFATMPLPPDPDVLAPDGSQVRILLRLAGGSMAHFRLDPGETSIACGAPQRRGAVVRRRRPRRNLAPPGQRRRGRAARDRCLPEHPAGHGLPVSLHRLRALRGCRGDDAALARRRRGLRRRRAVAAARSTPCDRPTTCAPTSATSPTSRSPASSSATSRRCSRTPLPSRPRWTDCGTTSRACAPNAIVGIESRGFLFGTPIAARLGLPFVPIRKPGKLPAAHMSIEYALEYGEGQLDIHADALVPAITSSSSMTCWRPAALPRGRTAWSRMLGARVAGLAFLIELSGLAWS